MIEHFWIFTNSMDVGKNGPEQTIIVVLVLAIDKQLLLKNGGVSIKDSAPKVAL